ncbi:MAG: hypothetical protein V1856_02160 [Candidatus Liptonbacteria bacterium]
MEFKIRNLKEKYGLIFWFHLVIIVLIWTSPFWLSWKIILFIIFLYYFQLWLIGDCILTKWQFQTKTRSKTFYSHLLQKMKVSASETKVRIFVDYVLPWLILGFAYWYQN